MLPVSAMAHRRVAGGDTLGHMTSSNDPNLPPVGDPDTPTGAHSGDSPVQPPRLLRGQRAIRIGAILLAVGVLIAIVSYKIAKPIDEGKVNGFQRVGAGDQNNPTVTFEHPGDYVAYYELIYVPDQVPLIPTTLTNQADGQVVTLSTPYGNRPGWVKYLHYNHGGHNGVAMWQFRIDHAGTYTVKTDDSPLSPVTVAFGPSIARSHTLGTVGYWFGELLVLSGLIVLIVGFVKRRRHKRALRAGYSGVPPAG
jgi:hypothetical protein